jgi:DnaK suppressor protein
MHRRSNSKAKKGGVARRKRRAVTSEVLAPPQPKPRVPNKWRAHFERLTKLRDQLLRSGKMLVEDAREENPTFSTHMADAGTDTFDQDFALGMLSTEQDSIYEIEQALERIRDGTYGICQLTGKPIDERRLAAIPWTRFTADAERELEREGEIRRARLGQRDTVAKSNTSTQVAEEQEEG